MIDITRIRENAGEVEAALQKRGFKISFTEFLQWDKESREAQVTLDGLKNERNRVSSEIPLLKKAGQDVTDLIASMKKLGDEIKELDEKHGQLKQKIKDTLDTLPNTPADDVLPGGKENNKVTHIYGEKPAFDFEPKDHVSLVQSLGLIDYERGVKLSGNNFWIYTADGARLEWALLNFFIDEANKAGFEFMLVPHILNYESGYTAGQFPKFQDDVFALSGTSVEDDNFKFVLPTAETALANIHRNELLSDEELPKRYFSYTPCYRSEAGGYGAAERGMIRGHQFNKVELFVYCKPEDSEKELQALIAHAENIMKALGLHYQVSNLAAGDCSGAMAKTLDIEVWIPSMNLYKEVSSASAACDYQARRGNMKYKDGKTGKKGFLHTLNASGLATSRLFPAILEQFQQKDGSVKVPEVLRARVGKDILKPK